MSSVHSLIMLTFQESFPFFPFGRPVEITADSFCLYLVTDGEAGGGGGDGGCAPMISIRTQTEDTAATWPYSSVYPTSCSFGNHDLCHMSHCHWCCCTELMEHRCCNETPGRQSVTKSWALVLRPSSCPWYHHLFWPLFVIWARLWQLESD